jgi:MFS family permease
MGGGASRRERQKDEFGGFSWLSTLAGWLSAAGLTAILTGILSGAGAALALNQVGDKVSGSEAETIGLAGGIALLVVLAVGYFFGGYVAGRMARFDGARQGVGVWLWGIIIAVVVAALAAIGGSEYNVLDALNLPRLPVNTGTLTTGGIIALALSLAVTLGTAIVGGKAGERFHKKVDRI